MNKENITKEEDKKIRNFFIDSLNGMAYGLFATLIIGTIFATIGTFFNYGKGNPFCDFMVTIIGTGNSGISYILQILTGAGIGIGIAISLKLKPLQTIVLAAVGEAAAYFSLSTIFVSDSSHPFTDMFKIGDPLTIYLVCIVVAFTFKLLFKKKTSADIILIPLLGIIIGLCVSLLVRFPAIYVTYGIQWLVNSGTQAVPFVMGIVVAVLMGMTLTAPISSAAICASFGLVGLAGGAAVAGCCAQMVGFAVMSYKENKVGGLISQGIGTSMLQMPNIVKNPKIWIAPTLASAITGPIATCVFGLQMNGAAINSGMGTCGLCGPIGVITGWFSPSDAAVAKDLVALAPSAKDWIGLALVCVVLPAILSFIFCEVERKIGWIKENDLKLPE